VYSQIQSEDALITSSTAKVLGIDRNFIGMSLREAVFENGIRVVDESFGGLTDGKPFPLPVAPCAANCEEEEDG